MSAGLTRSQIIDQMSKTTQEGASDVGTYVIAAYNADDIWKERADYTMGSGEDIGAKATEVMAALNSSYGGVLLCSPGLFNQATPVYMPDKSFVSLKGCGPSSTSFKLDASANCAMIAKTTPGTPRYRCSIREIGLDGNSANNATGTYGINMDGLEQAIVRDVRVYDTKSHGVYALDCDSSRFDNVRSVDCGGYGFYAHQSAGLGGNFIYTSGCYGGLVISNSYECFFTNVSLDQDESEHSLYFQGSQRCHVTNLWAAPMKQYKAAIYFYSSKDCGVHGGSIEPVSGADSDLVGVYFYAATETTTTGCVVEGVSIDGTDVTDMRAIRETVAGSGTITNCVVTNCPISGITKFRHTSSNYRGTQFVQNPGWIAPGEIRTLNGTLAGVTPAGIMLSVDNPFGQAVRVLDVDIDITTQGAGSGTMCVGVGSSATTDYATIFSVLPTDPGTTYPYFYRATKTATYGVLTSPINWATGSGNRYLNFYAHAANNGLVATYTVTVMGV